MELNLKQILEQIEQVAPKDKRDWLRDNDVDEELHWHILHCFPEHDLSDMDGPIQLTVLGPQDDHFLIQFAEPGRVEIALKADPQRPPDGDMVVPKTRIVALVFRGAEVIDGQQPVGMYDGTRKLGTPKSWAS